MPRFGIRETKVRGGHVNDAVLRKLVGEILVRVAEFCFLMALCWGFYAARPPALAQAAVCGCLLHRVWLRARPAFRGKPAGGKLSSTCAGGGGALAEPLPALVLLSLPTRTCSGLAGLLFIEPGCWPSEKKERLLFTNFVARLCVVAHGGVPIAIARGG